MREVKSRDERGEQRGFCLPSVTVRDVCPKETSVCFLKSLFFLELELERMQVSRPEWKKKKNARKPGCRGGTVGHYGERERKKERIRGWTKERQSRSGQGQR